MALLETMPPIEVPTEDLLDWSAKWLVKRAFSKKEGMDFGGVFDRRVGASLAVMLGGIPLITPSARDLQPNFPPDVKDAVEVGPVRVIGGIRPQNYDVGYRPDGIRFAFDSKTLNDTKSVGKNFQNMVNDLGTEAMTVHTRFPFALVGFMVVIPGPCFGGALRTRFTRMLDRLVGRSSPIDVAHKAEAAALVLWSPETATIDANWPETGSPLRIERFSEQIQDQYHKRYDGMAPHDQPSKEQKRKLEQMGEEIPEAADTGDHDESGD